MLSQESLGEGADYLIQKVVTCANLALGRIMIAVCCCETDTQTQFKVSKQVSESLTARQNLE